MSARCDGCETDSGVHDPTYRRILWIVLGINLFGFAMETGAGIVGRSAALQADALDFLGDSANYAIALFVLGRSIRWRASAAMIKGISMLVFGLWVFGSAIYRIFVLGTPDAAVMGTAGVVALFANLICAFLLFRFREGDSNVRSVWLCTRNDAIGNVAVLLAAVLVASTGTGWPDLVVAIGMALLALTASFQIIGRARAELAAEAAPAAS